MTDDIDRQPSAREVRVFALLLVLFAGVLGGMVVRRPMGLLGAAAALALAWLVCAAFNADYRRKPLLGLTLPAGLALLGAAALLSGMPRAVRAGVWGAGLALALVILARPAFGAGVWRGWMRAAEPIGWTFSHLVLALVYYGVLTPIGLLMRLFGRDPLHRRLDRQGASYWVERKAERDPGRAFRQF